MKFMLYVLYGGLIALQIGVAVYLGWLFARRRALIDAFTTPKRYGECSNRERELISREGFIPNDAAVIAWEDNALKIHFFPTK